MSTSTLKHAGGTLLLLLLLVELSHCIPTSEEIAQSNAIGYELVDLQYVSSEERMVKINNYLDTVSGRNFVGMLGAASAIDLFKGISLDVRLNFYRAALTKQDADYSIEPGSLDPVPRIGILQFLGAVCNSLKEAGIEPPPSKTVKLEQQEGRQRLVDLIDDALTQISQKTQEPSPGNKNPTRATDPIPQRLTPSVNQSESATANAPNEAITPSQWLLWTLAVLVVVGTTALLIKRKSE